MQCVDVRQEEARSFGNEKALAYLHENAKMLDKRFRIPLWLQHIGPQDIYAHQLADRHAACLASQPLS